MKLLCSFVLFSLPFVSRAQTTGEAGATTYRSLRTSSVDNILYVDGAEYATIQAAVSAACNASPHSAVVIPPTYTGTDGFTNSCGAYVQDLRPPAITSPPAEARSVKEWGAKCDWSFKTMTGSDDTAAITAALNSGNGNYTVTLPPNLCRITSPITVITTDTNYPSIIGVSPSNSGIVADYTNFPAAAPGIFEINTTGRVTSTYGPQSRKIANFVLFAYNVGTVQSVGFDIRTTAPDVTSRNVAQYLPLYNADIENIYFPGIYQPIQISEGFNLRLRDLSGLGTTNCINIAGYVVQTVIDQAYFGVAKGSGTCLNVGTKTYSDGIERNPESYHVTHSAFVGFGVGANLGSLLEGSITDTVIDLCSSAALVVSNPNNFRVTGDWLSEAKPNNSVFEVLSPKTNLDGLWIEDNIIIANSATGTFGIRFRQGDKVRRGVHIARNRIGGVEHPISLEVVPTYSDVRDNFGVGNRGPFITTSAGPCPTIEFSGNKSVDDFDILSVSCQGYTTGPNFSPTQTTAITAYSFGLTKPFVLGAAPSILSGFGTLPTIVQQNGTAAFEVNVGTGGTATNGVISMPRSAAGWSCQAADMNTNITTRETAYTTTTITLTALSAWAANDKLLVNCVAF